MSRVHMLATHEYAVPCSWSAPHDTSLDFALVISLLMARAWRPITGARSPLRRAVATSDGSKREVTKSESPCYSVFPYFPKLPTEVPLA